MKLSEIIQISTSAITPASIMYDASDTHLVYKNKHDIYVIGNDDSVIYCIFDDLSKPAICYLEISSTPFATIAGNEYHDVRNIYTHPAHRGKSLILYIRQYLSSILHIGIISDNGVTSSGITNLKKTIDSNIFKVSYYNTNTRQHIESAPPDLWNNINWRILFESKRPNKSALTECKITRIPYYLHDVSYINAD